MMITENTQKARLFVQDKTDPFLSPLLLLHNDGQRDEVVSLTQSSWRLSLLELVVEVPSGQQLWR
jgi:hypothetical protein